MNFFDAQDKARRATKWLVVVYVAATALIVAGVTLVVAATFFGLGAENRPPDPGVLIGTAVAATLLIVGGTLYRMARLSSGGGRVATELGGVKVPADVADPLRRRLRNVVEEISIASGVPVPEIYVLEKEPGINAFAAGYTSGDAAIAVTRGALELLDRDELQGVIAHEFSHVLNGDMRLNIRMMGVLFGIMVISLVGRMILRGTHGGMSSSRNSRSSGGIVVLGLGLTVLGWIGVFFARLIKAAVSRQREYLADASAVQFTRQTTGIANALKKIGGYRSKSYFQAADAEEVSHMLFGPGARFSSMFATHPPLDQRIQALEPGFDPSQYPDVRPRQADLPDQQQYDSPVSSLASNTRTIGVSADSIVDSVGQPGPAHVGFATALRRSIPKSLRGPAHSPSHAYLVALALLLDTNEELPARQFDFLRGQLGAERAGLVARYYQEIADLGEVYRLPLLEIAFPALKLSPTPQLEFLLDLGRRLIQLDGRISYREFCYFRILSRTLAQAIDPSAPISTRRAPKSAVRRAATELIRLLADRGHDTLGAKEAAFRAGLAEFGAWASDNPPFELPTMDTVDAFEECLGVLDHMNGAATQTLLKAVTATVVHDDHINVPEAEMIRALCASLDCPLPPLLAETTDFRADSSRKKAG